jgi:hypothetical protein
MVYMQACKEVYSRWVLGLNQGVGLVVGLSIGQGRESGCGVDTESEFSRKTTSGKASQSTDAVSTNCAALDFQG